MCSFHLLSEAKATCCVEVAVFGPRQKYWTLVVVKSGGCLPPVGSSVQLAVTRAHKLTLRECFCTYESLYFIKVDNKMACSVCSNDILPLNIHIVFITVVKLFQNYINFNSIDLNH